VMWFIETQFGQIQVSVVINGEVCQFGEGRSVVYAGNDTC
jgi:hypothetical protein